MKILVNGVKKELIANGINGIEWTNDLLGNYGALHYDREHESYTLSEDEFDWWEEVIEMLNEVVELEESLSSDDREEYDTETWPGDLDDEVKAKLAWLRSKAEQ